jgi:L-lactate dehydrogenase complex protein LldG
MAGTAIDDLLAGFGLRAEALGVKVGLSSPGETAARFLAALAQSWETDEAVIAPAALAAFPWLPASLAEAEVRWRIAGTPETTRDAPLGIGAGELALAETGSVLMVESTLEDRSVGMLAAGLLIVVPTAGLAPGLDEAAPVLRDAARRRHYATLVTGPSRTADIERVLTVGVQGPARVAVLFVNSQVNGVD